MITSLDTCVLIELINRRSAATRDRYLDARARGVEFVISTLVYQELLVGAYLSERVQAQLERLAVFLAGFTIFPFTNEDSARTAEVRAEQRLAGQPIGGLDTLIGGQALARGWCIATANLKDFNRIPGLVVEDWTPNDKGAEHG